MAGPPGGSTKYARAPVLGLIRLYQRTLSLDHGPLRFLAPGGYCQYQPSCSEYTYQAVASHGVIRGIGLGAWRILRCNPWSSGGVDPVPGSHAGTIV